MHSQAALTSSDSGLAVRRGRADTLAESVGLYPSPELLLLQHGPLGLEYYMGRADALAAGHSPVDVVLNADAASVFHDAAAARYSARVPGARRA